MKDDDVMDSFNRAGNARAVMVKQHSTPFDARGVAHAVKRRLLDLTLFTPARRR